MLTLAAPARSHRIVRTTRCDNVQMGRAITDGATPVLRSHCGLNAQRSRDVGHGSDEDTHFRSRLDRSTGNRFPPLTRFASADVITRTARRTEEMGNGSAAAGPCVRAGRPSRVVRCTVPVSGCSPRHRVGRRSAERAHGRGRRCPPRALEFARELRVSSQDVPCSCNE